MSKFNQAAKFGVGLVALCLSLSSIAGIVEKKTPAQIMPITHANIRGHEALYHEGWFVVTSTEKSWAYARSHAVESSADALRRLAKDLEQDSVRLGQRLGAGLRDSVETGRDIYTRGSERTRKTLDLTHELAQAELDLAGRGLQRAWSSFYHGNISLVQRTESDREALMALPGNYYRNLKDDFSNLFDLTEKAEDALSSHIEGRWAQAYREAGEDFTRAYQRSGERGNSAAALGDMLSGYMRMLYSGLVKPAVRSGVQGGEATAKLAGKLIFLPVASLFIVTENTVASLGMSLYYVGDMGVKIVSPTVEGGFLTGLSLLSYTTVPVTYGVGGAAGLVNQVAVTTAAPVASAGQAVAGTAVDTVRYAAQVSYDLAKGVTRVSLNQVKAGVALGYNALTALPVQLTLAAANSVVFLAWDGPRLVLASARGEVQWRDEQGSEQSVSLDTLPVGGVVDLQRLQQEPGVSVELLSDDPAVVEKVLERVGEDLRVEPGHE